MLLRRVLVLGYGALAYLAFLAVTGYTIGFLAGRGVPKGVDDGPTGPAWTAILVDAGLLGLFALQHSVMARAAFKRRWTRLVPPSVERSTYVLLASLLVALLMWQWRPLPDPVWTAAAGPARTVLWLLYFAGWAVLVYSTFLIGHFDLFGLRQVFARIRGRHYADPGFREPALYRIIRHPIMVGFLIAFWAAPDMSRGRLLFAAAATGYILVGVRLEERELTGQLGGSYRSYLERTPRFVPRPATLTQRRPRVPAADTPTSGTT